MSKFESFWNLAPDMNTPGILNMYVYGRITSTSHWFFGSDSDVVTSHFIEDLKKHPNAKRINVYINSPGGDVFAAAAIYNQLRSHDAEVHSYIDGLGASAAVGLAMGADTVHMSRSSLIMIHNPKTGAEGEVKDLQRGINVLEKVKSTLINIYDEKTDLGAEKLAALMDNETWLTADEALALGFVDAIVEDEGLLVEDAKTGFIVNGVPFDFLNVNAMKVDKFTFSNNISEHKLREKLSQIKQKQGGNHHMTFEEILNSLSDIDATLVNEHLTQSIENAITDKQQEWDEEKEVLNARITELEQEAAEAAEPVVDAVVDPEQEILNSLSPEAREMFESAMRDKAEAEAKLAEAEKQEQYAAFKEHLSAYDALPMQEEQIQALHEIAVADEEGFAHIESLLKVANEAISAGFDSIGSDQGVPAAQNAFDEINAKVAELMKTNEALDYNAALRQVANQHPDLYRRYREE